MEIRAATADDDDAVLGLLQASMGWVPDEQHARYFAWKHRESPFGPSPAWVAVDGGRVIGFRTFMRWQLVDGDRVVDAVRAVDTATHPEFQGRGIFSRLTYHALDELRAAGVGFVFNTPNDNSRPGYLKMGWKLIRRLPVAARPRSPLALVRLARARTPADKWSAECATGSAALEPLADGAAVARLLQASRSGLRTRLSPEYLHWRYGFPPLRYRAVTAPGGPAEGLVVFRLRRRGAATEAAICELLVPGDNPRLSRALLGRVVRDTGADYAVMLGPARTRLGFLPVPGQGPTLVWRGVNDTTPPSSHHWQLALGDIELF